MAALFSGQFRYHDEANANSALAMENGEVKLPRGKVLGGSSMLNWAIHVRGHAGDYDEWASLGNPGWSYQEVLPFFKKSQNFVGKITGDQDKYHGQGGPLAVMPTGNYQSLISIQGGR